MVDAVVIQADREAAASGYFAWIGSNPVIPAKMRSGNADDHSMVQAFARARTEATAELVEALEAASEILESYVEFLHRMPADDLELHPYIPAVEDAFDKARAALAKHLTDGPGLTERLEKL